MAAIRRSQWVLTKREREILEMVAVGFSYKTVAAMLHITYQTVKNHVYNAFDHLGLVGRERRLITALCQAYIWGEIELC